MERAPGRVSVASDRPCVGEQPRVAGAGAFTRRRFLGVLAGAGALVGATALFHTKEECLRSESGLKALTDKFREGELLLPGDPRTRIAVLPSTAPTKVVICLTDIPQDLLPAVLRALGERGVHAKNVLLTDPYADGQHLERGALKLECVEAARNRLERAGMPENHVKGPARRREETLHVIHHYTSGTFPDDPRCAPLVAVITRTREVDTTAHPEGHGVLWGLRQNPNCAIVEVGALQRRQVP